jgi:hypothetical protein
MATTVPVQDAITGNEELTILPSRSRPWRNSIVR